ncbi:zonadhesin-like [Scyliorhinus canicula]|uniref:zonadhesin-like n=1 Tax=Scyliorhinus canicula TaxID=7830 RepID=UPI0018F2C488|nr:zonadhesin-like [Scyliorhinus canicula]
MAEEKPTVASSVEAGGIKTSTQSEVIDVIGGAGDAVQSTEDKFPTGELNKFFLSETTTTTEGAKSNENSSSSAEETVTSTGETNLPREGDISAADTISNIKDTNSSTEQVTAFAHQTSLPAQATIPCIEEASSLTESIPCIEEIRLPTAKINANAQETYSPTQSTTPCIEENSSSTEKVSASAQEISSPEQETIPCIEETSPTAETVIASVQETSSSAQAIILCTEETSPPREQNIPVAETIPGIEGARPPAKKVIAFAQETNSPAQAPIPCIGETISPTEQAILTTQEIKCPTEDINSSTEEACVHPEVAMQETSADATVPFEMKTSFPIEQAVTLTENAVVSAEKMNQAIGDMDSATEGAIQSTTGIIIPTVMTIQDVNPESEVVTSCQLIEEELENSLVENSADGENGEAVPAGQEVIPLPTEEVYKENGKADTNVKDCNADDNGDDTGADEEIYSEEFQQGNDSSDSPSTVSILSSQPESPTNTDSAEDRPGASKRPDIAKHSYSRYNTVSYRKIRKGNTKQRIDEFESMVHIN